MVQIGSDIVPGMETLRKDLYLREIARSSDGLMLGSNGFRFTDTSRKDWKTGRL